MSCACRICGNSESNTRWNVPEMMFGTGETFAYFQCAQCGCLQIVELPPNLGRYYPRNTYYSLSSASASHSSSIQRYLKHARMDYILAGRNLLGRLVTLVKGRPSILSLIAHVGVTFEDKVLDVGSGTGYMLIELRECGFTHLTGIDPYIDKDVRYSNGLAILKKTPEELDEQYDFIMLHHSFEHMWDPLETLRQLHRHLTPGHHILIRIPTVDSFAWEKYREKWVQLDAPRHLYLHSRKSMELLASQAGFKVWDVIYDSTGFQFWGSEQYLKGISLDDPRSVAKDKASPLFTSQELKHYEREAARLNEAGKGDMAAFYLVRL